MDGRIRGDYLCFNMDLLMGKEVGVMKLKLGVRMRISNHFR